MTDAMTLPPQLSPRDWFPKRLVVALRTLSILKDDPGNSKLAWLLHTAMDDRTYERLGRRVRESEDRTTLDARRTIPGERTLEGLATLPERTLGHVFAGYFATHGITPFTYEFPVESDADFLYKRYRETHDIHHMLTGYGLDPIGEIELQAFYIGNLKLRHAALIAMLSFPYVLWTTGFSPRAVRDLTRRLGAAYRRGKAAPNLLLLPYDTLWERPVDELAKAYCPVATT